MRCALIVLVLFAAQIASAGELRGLAADARSILGTDQGVYVESADGSVLLAQHAARAVHPASVSKVPTTLALLRKFGPEHRFLTTFASSGRIVNGTLEGDLVVAADGDPSLVDEDALLITARLNALGIARIGGALRPRGPLTFDWQPDGDGAHLAQALSGGTPAAAWSVVQALQLPNPDAALPGRPEIRFVNSRSSPDGASTEASELPGARTLVIHRSQPLLSLVKALNDYSNNIFKPLAEQAGGAAAVERVARGAVPQSLRSEIILGDGAGTDPRNRLSPRAAVKLLRALEGELALSGHQLFDVLPVCGVDEGTLRDRLNGPAEVGHVVGKTGTFDSYGASALIGAISTRDRGTVYFAILNHGVPVPAARRRQDRFVRALLGRLDSVSWNYQPDGRPAIARVQVLAGGG